MKNKMSIATGSKNIFETANINGGFAVMATESLVPMEDQAVDEVKAPLSIYNPYEGLFPAEDLEIEIEDKPGDFAEAEKLGFFSPLIGMAKLPNTDLEYYARICQDSEGKKRIELIQRYESGEVSPMIAIKQSDLFRAVRSQYGEVTTLDKRTKRAVENFLFKLEDECLGKFDGRMSFDILEILESLALCYDALPITYDATEEENPASLYSRIIDILLRDQPGNDETAYLYGHKMYYPLDKEDIERIAKEMKMHRTELLKLMKRYNLLYLTKSSVGYQTNVRIAVTYRGEAIDPRTERRYCLIRAKYFTDKLAEKAEE